MTDVCPDACNVERLTIIRTRSGVGLLLLPSRWTEKGPEIHENRSQTRLVRMVFSHLAWQQFIALLFVGKCDMALRRTNGNVCASYV